MRYDLTYSYVDDTIHSLQNSKYGLAKANATTMKYFYFKECIHLHTMAWGQQKGYFSVQVKQLLDGQEWVQDFRRPSFPAREDLG